MKVHKQSKKEISLKCKWCHLVYSSKPAKSRHQKSCKLAPKTVTFCFNCVRCSYKTNRKDAFKRHEAACLKKRDKTCPICNKNFQRHTHLKSHMKTHERLQKKGTLSHKKNFVKFLLMLKKMACVIFKLEPQNQPI